MTCLKILIMSLKSSRKQQYFLT